MSKFFTRERFGEPQVVAGLLLLIFLFQCLWLVSKELQTGEIDSDEMLVLQDGLARWRGQSPADLEALSSDAHKGTATSKAGNPEASTLTGGHGESQLDSNHSALYYLVASAPLLLWPEQLQRESVGHWGWLAHIPFVFFGGMLGASLWYVARRLYGNSGGYVALTLYCFAPGVIRSSTLWYAKPETGAAWGAFGSIFTAIAVSHTLYAPREVVLWNWRRIVLLGISLALAIGSQFSLVVLVPLVLGFLIYLAPERRGAGFIIWAAACSLSGFLLFASYGFHPSGFEGLRHARFFGYSLQALGIRQVYKDAFAESGQICPAMMIAVPAALLAFACWRKARYFGNTAPLLVGALFLVLGIASPHYPGLGFRLLAVPFFFLFIAGVTADLMETRFRSLVQACTWGLLSAYALWSLMELARVMRT